MSTSIHDLLLNDRGFAFDPVNGDTFQLSTTGLRVVRLMQAGTDEAAMLQTLRDEYEVDEHTARRDLQVFLESMRQLGWES